jgi:hypothetical protein
LGPGFRGCQEIGCIAAARLEGRTALIKLIVNFLTASFAGTAAREQFRPGRAGPRRPVANAQ